MRKLRVRGRAGVLVPNPFVLGMNPPRFVGKAPAEGVAADAPLLDRYRDIEEELPDALYLRMAVREGSLVAVDADTARLCGVPGPKKGKA